MPAALLVALLDLLALRMKPAASPHLQSYHFVPVILYL
jgi:hypothetical protein